MKTNEKIRQKRKALGLTQEQVADYLGVSTPAVCKWESGLSYPDVGILVPLARLLKTDLNTLLCFRENLSEEEIAHIMNEIAETAEKEGVQEAFAMAREKVQEYPSCAHLLHSLALVLQGMQMMYFLPEEEQETIREYITGLYERTVQCEDPVYSNQARYMLASEKIRTGEYEKAQELLKPLPDTPALDKKDLQIQIWMQQGNNLEAAVWLETKLRTNLQKNLMLLDRLAQIAVKEGNEDHALRLAACSQQETELYGLWKYSSYVVSLTVAVSGKQVRESIKILREMLDELLTPWNPADSLLYKYMLRKQNQESFREETGKETINAPISENRSFGRKMLPRLLEELENSPEYEFLREETEFQKLLEEYHCKS